MANKPDNSIAKRSMWLDRQKPGMKSLLRKRNQYDISAFEDFRPSLKKLIFGSNIERYAELFKSPNTPDSIDPNPEISV